MSDSVGSVSVEVVPDARGWSEKLDSQIRNAQAKVKVEADTEEAKAEIDETARDRTSTVKVRADTSQLAQGASALDDFVGKLGLLPALALTAGSALIPLAAAVGGVVAALAAPLAVAAGGAGIFALFGSVAVKQTEKQLKNVDTLKKKLDGLTKGTATYAATQKQLKDAQAALSPAQNHFADSLDRVKNAFTGILNGPAGQSVLNTIASGLDALAKILPVLAPVLAPVAREFGHLIDQLGRAAQSHGFADFIHQFAHQVGPDIDAFAHIAGNFAKGLGGLFLALDNKHLSGGVLDGLVHLSHNFANLGTGAKGSQWLKDFIEYFHKVGPQVGSTLGSVARAIGHIVEALAPLGPVALHVIKGIADAISGIPIPVLTALAGATAGLVAFQKLGGLKATSFALSKLGGGPGGVAGGLLGGIQKVFVVNMPPGGPGGGGVPNIVKDAEKVAPAAGLTPTLPELVGLAVSAGIIAYAVKHDVIPTGRRAVAEQAFPNVPVGGVSAANNPGAGQHLPLAIDPAAHARAIAILGGDKPITQMQRATAGLQASLGRASTSIDLVGPHAQHAFGIATHAAQAFQAQLDGLHSKQLAIIVKDGAAITSLERLQAYRIQNKYFTVYQRSQALDRAVGPGGGIGSSPHTGGPQGGASGGAGRTHVHVHLDDSGRATLSGYMEDSADRVYHANHRYAQDVSGR